MRKPRTPREPRQPRRYQSKTFSNLTDLSIDVRGSRLFILYQGKKMGVYSIGPLISFLESLLDSGPEEQGEVEGGANALAMAAAYSAVRQKYSGMPFRITSDSKYWPQIIAAANQADEMGVDYNTWCEAITDKLTEFNPDQHVRVPWLGQLSGEKAAMYVTDYAAGSKQSPEVVGTRRARTASGVGLNEDAEYQAIRLRMKRHQHTLADVAYVETRHREIYGEPKEWVKKFRELADQKYKRFPPKEVEVADE